VPSTLVKPALYWILAGYLGVSAAEVELRRTPAGKPYLAGGVGPAFNLSHSGSSAVLAVSVREQVGVDIEQLKGRARDSLIERVLSAEEAAVLWACPPAERELSFLRYWTAKEACLKAWGTGLSGDLRALQIADPLGRPTVVGGGLSQLELQHFDPQANVVGTVAVSGGPWRAVPRRFSPGYLG
jgi:4'-phosphopantetheinyl transferase